MTSAYDAFPDWCEAVLPSGHLSIGSATMFEKDEATIFLDDTPDLLQGLGNIRDRTEGLRHDGSVDAGIGERHRVLSRLQKEFDLQRTGQSDRIFQS
jgi:hypothetical protein